MPSRQPPSRMVPMNDSSRDMKSSKTLSRRSRSKSRDELSASKHKAATTRPYSWRDLPTSSGHSNAGHRGRSKSSKSKRLLSTNGSHHSKSSRGKGGLSTSAHSKAASSRSRSRNSRGSGLNISNHSTDSGWSSDDDDEAKTTNNDQKLAVSVVNKIAQQRINVMNRKSKLRQHSGSQETKIERYSYNDFHISKSIGEGGFGQVLKVRLTDKKEEELRTEKGKFYDDESITFDFALELDDDENVSTNNKNKNKSKTRSSNLLMDMSKDDGDDDKKDKKAEKKYYALKRLNNDTLSLALSDTAKSKKLLTATLNLGMEIFILSQLEHDNIVKVHGISNNVPHGGSGGAASRAAEAARRASSISRNSSNCSTSSTVAAAAAQVASQLSLSMNMSTQLYSNDESENNGGDGDDDDDGRPIATYNGNFFIMDLLHKRTLKDRLEIWRRQQRSSDLTYTMMKHRIDNIAVGIAKALEYLHSKNILYRDLKPENIGFDAKTETVKLFDFGLARELHLLGQCKTAGTLRYIAPEVVTKNKAGDGGGGGTHGGKRESTRSALTTTSSISSCSSISSEGSAGSTEALPSHHRASSSSQYSYGLSSDVYSFGVLLWEICTIGSPFEEYIKDPKQFRKKVHKKHWRPSTDKVLSKTVQALIEDCWDPNPSTRPTFPQIVCTLEGPIPRLRSLSQEPTTTKGRRSRSTSRDTTESRRIRSSSASVASAKSAKSTASSGSFMNRWFGGMGRRNSVSGAASTATTTSSRSVDSRSVKSTNSASKRGRKPGRMVVVHQRRGIDP